MRSLQPTGDLLGRPGFGQALDDEFAQADVGFEDGRPLPSSPARTTTVCPSTQAVRSSSPMTLMVPSMAPLN